MRVSNLTLNGLLRWCSRVGRHLVGETASAGHSLWDSRWLAYSKWFRIRWHSILNIQFVEKIVSDSPLWWKNNIQKFYTHTHTHTHTQTHTLLLLLSRFSRIRLLATPWTAAHQAPPSMDFPGKSTEVGCHCLLWHIYIHTYNMGFPGSSASKESTCNVGDLGLIPGLRRSPGGGYSNPLKYSCLENSMVRGAWQATVHGVTESQIQLSN